MLPKMQRELTYFPAKPSVPSPSETMEITLNGKAYALEESSITIDEFVAGLEIGKAPVLVELNGEAVFAREFNNRTIKDGDTVEVIRMVAGG